MSQPISRRRVIQGSAAVAAAGAFGFTARSYANIVGANEDIRVGVIGFRSRGNSHIDAWRKIDGVRLVALCDADKDVLGKKIESLEKGGSEKPKNKKPKPVANADRKEMAGKPDEAEAAAGNAAGNAAAERKAQPKIEPYTDLRKLLDSKEIDAISTATPNHWHALISIWACQAGKDVYVEKPVSHNVSEGRRIVEAARKYKRIVQTGTQSRANTALADAYQWVQQGGLGKIKVARGLCYKRRPSIGQVKGGVGEVPASVNYDLWLGPAPKEQPHRTQFHYDWHWFWAYGNGDLGNQGIHQMDTARWALGKNTLAPKVLSVGGRFGYEDDGETPNTQFVIQDYGDSLLIFEVRGLPKKTGSVAMDKYKGSDGVGCVIECEDGYLVDKGYTSSPMAYDNKGELVKKFTLEESGDRNLAHFQNWIDCVRSRKVEDLNADILEGHLSSALCHTGNISYRLGKTQSPREIREALAEMPAAMETYGRFRDHLDDNDVSLFENQATLGAFLSMDVEKEVFTGEGAEAANKLLTRDYRKPFEVPKSV